MLGIMFLAVQWFLSSKFYQLYTHNWHLTNFNRDWNALQYLRMQYLVKLFVVLVLWSGFFEILINSLCQESVKICPICRGSENKKRDVAIGQKWGSYERLGAQMGVGRDARG